MSRSLPARVKTKLSVLFAGSEREEALRLLPERPAAFGEYGYERLLMSVAKPSEGRLDRLAYFAARAHDYPEDVVQWGALR